LRRFFAQNRAFSVAFVLIIGEAHRFDCGKQIAAYLGLVPEEDSSGERRRLGHQPASVLAGGSGAGNPNRTNSD